MIKITGFGGFREVGRMAISLEIEKKKFLFDYGINVQQMSFPIEPNKNWFKNLNAVFLSHSHLDHSGHIPYLYKRGYNRNVYATPVTFSLCSLLLRDSLKVQKKRGLEPPYLVHYIEKMEHLAKHVGHNKKISFNGVSFEFYNAGHTPGSVATMLETENKKILYTGDIKFSDTNLLKGAHQDYKNIDVLMCEATYSCQNHPNRKELTNRLKEHIQNTVHNNGIAIIPSFAIGRTQEMLVALHDLGIPIYMDGMGIDATRRILSYPEFLKEPKKLRKAFSLAHKIRDNRDRKEAIRKPCIIITTSGMLTGGPVWYYIKKLHKKENCSLILNGYQIEDTPGRILLNTGRIIGDNLNVKPKMNTGFFDFSAHTDHDHLLNFFNKVNPKKIIIVHTDNGPEFAKELNNKGFDACSPNIGETLKI